MARRSPLKTIQSRAQSGAQAHPRRAPPSSARCRNGISTIFIPASIAREIKRDLARADADCVGVRAGLQGQARGDGGGRTRRAGTGRGGEALRGDRRPARPARFLCRAASMPATATIRRSRSSTATCRSASPPPRSHLLFFTLELNRIDDAVLDAAMADPALGHYRPWLEDVRKEKPYQLEDRVEQLFHEKSVTGLFGLEPAVRRDHRVAALQDRRQGAGDRAGAQFHAGRRRQEAQGGGAKRWPRPSRKICGRSR